MCFSILASLVLFTSVVESTICSSRQTIIVKCSCWDMVHPSGTIQLDCNINTLDEIHILSRTSYSNRISSLTVYLYGIPSLPSLAFRFSNLTSLTVFGQSLISVHKDAFYLVREKLETLNIVGTLLHQVPADAVNSLIKLNTFFMRYNLISSFNVTLKTSLLENLVIPSNAISTIASGAFPSSLRHLDLSRNKLGSLNGVLRKQLPNLTAIVISENEIRSLQGVFEGTPRLYRLNADRNLIVTIDDLSLQLVPHLTQLDLSYNRILEIHDGLNVLPRIRHLVLDHNRIDTVNKTAFQNCTHLNVLKLNNNRITQLPDGLFDCVTSLQVLYINDNFLTNLYFLSLPNTAIKNTLESKTKICDFWKNSSLEVLDMTGNRIVCNERAEQIIGMLRSKGVLVAGTDCLK